MTDSKECMYQNNLYHIEEELLTAAAEKYCEFEIIYEHEKKYIKLYFYCIEFLFFLSVFKCFR